MVLKFFTGVVIMLLIVYGITAIFEYEADRCNDHWYEGSKKYKNAINKIADIMNVILNIAIIIFFISNIAILICGIVNKYISFITVGVLFIISMIFDWLEENTKIFPKIIQEIASLTFAFYVAILMLFFLFQFINTPNTETNVRKVNTINIIELQKVPYTNVSGTRYYIRSEPSLAYYYDIITDNGNKTTKVIDGYKNYVERCEDDIYKENPHIDVFEVVEKYTNGYGIEWENVKNYEYYIYIPKDSTYFTDKE